MNIYQKGRYKSDLAKSDIAKELGIDYNRYNMIEKGEVKMPVNLINKFNQIVNKGKNENALETLNNKEVVEKWYQEMTSKDEKGHYKMEEKLKEFNIKSFVQLSKLLGWSKSTMSYYMSKPELANYDAKNRVYMFFQNELNIQPKELKKKNKKVYSKKENPEVELLPCMEQGELADWYNNFDFLSYVTDILDKLSISKRKLQDAMGMCQGTLYNIINGKSAPNSETISKIQQFVYEHEEVNYMNYVKNLSTVFPDLPESKEKVQMSPLEIKIKEKMSKLEYEIQEGEMLLETYRTKINEIETLQNTLISELRIYKELLAEIESEE